VRLWGKSIILLSLLASIYAADISSIDRSILKKPSALNPKYCLLVFGPSAQTRIWLVLDGEILYVDRNGNLDLTETGERVKGLQKDGMVEFNAGPVTATEGVPPNTRLEVLTSPDLTFVYAHSEGRPWQRAVVDKQGYLKFGPTRETAPVLHFNGPLTMGLRFDNHLSRQKRQDVDVMVGTPGIGVGSFVRFGHEGVDAKAQPALEISYGGKEPAKIVLGERC
jgi:hypothetical protein